MSAYGFSPEFLAALRLLGSAMEEVAAAGLARHVLVGEAELQLWTTDRYVSGDLDLLAVDPAPMEAALIARGFRRKDRRGRVPILRLASPRSYMVRTLKRGMSKGYAQGTTP